MPERRQQAVIAPGEDKFRVSAPVLSLPKGGGAIKGIGEKFAANPVTGTGSMSVPIATSPGRSGFGPQLSLSYDSGAGNGPFGFGWSLSLPAITRKTDKGLPQYLDAIDSDVFLLSGAEDLVPAYRQDQDGTWIAAHAGYHRNPGEVWVRDSSGRLVIHEDDIDGYRVRRYRPRIEGLFARIERWTSMTDSRDVHWRSISKDNILTIYGRDSKSQILDQERLGRIFSWLISETRDDKGNGVVYRYKAEDGEGADLAKPSERNRGAKDDVLRAANRYLKHIYYGNRTTLLDAAGQRPRSIAIADIDNRIENADWAFEVVFDYGEHDASAPTPGDLGAWTYRKDPFSSYRAGFEVRTTRRCHRVLMFHHFKCVEPVGENCLVRSTDFKYSDEATPPSIKAPVYTFLQAVTQTGYRRNGTSYDQRSLPPVEFEYSPAEVHDTICDIDAASLENLPVGVDGSAYQWTDLHGEGIPGILTEQAGAWFYKRNLSPLGRQPVELAPLEQVASNPNLALAGGAAQFMDLAGDGLPDVVVMDGPTSGLYEHDEAEGWQAFRAFTSRLNRDFHDPNLKFVDLDGDGHADVLISEDEAFVWHASLAEDGFGPARRVARALDEEQGPRIVFADGTQSIYLADLSGDGLTDLARIRNGEVCYWPNLGYGRFGAKVTMDNAPWFDNPDQFDQKRIRLADIDGSGTTDIIYLHRDGVRLYFNQSGNGWSPPQVLKVFPRPDDVSSIVATDLLGNGTACLVWSSPLPGNARRQMRYVNLMGDQKPHLLVKSLNNLGAETCVRYAPSTKFYLQDKLDGVPWITRLPFPVHVVERVETYDRISRNRFVTGYTYHHGYFDGEEREFRGFGRVDQTDTEQFAALSESEALPVGDNFAADSHVPPVLTRTWFHTGAYLGGDSISRHFEDEYFRERGLDPDAARELLLDDTNLPEGLGADEAREACRALKGSMLRQEVYALDGSDKQPFAYTVTEQSFTIRSLQPKEGNRHAVFFTHAREAINFHYERNPADPRIQHALTLEVDDCGNVLKQAAVGYGRRKQIRTVDSEGKVQSIPNPGLKDLLENDQARQTTTLVTYTENQVTNAIDTPDVHRTPLPCEAATYELTGYEPSGPAERYQAKDFVEPDPNAAGRLRHIFSKEFAYEEIATGTNARRPIELLRTLYRKEVSDADPSDLLLLGHLAPLALPGESYKLAFTPGLLDKIFQRPRGDGTLEGLLPDPATVLVAGQAGNLGGYLQSQTLKQDGRFPESDPDDYWWIPSGRTYFTEHATDPATELAQASQHFYLPRRYRDPFGKEATVGFDDNELLMVETRDALGNCVKVGINDYRVLQPRLVSDPNGNQTEVAFDVLGMVVGTAVMGKPVPAPVEGDRLTGFVTDPDPTQLNAFMAAPSQEDPADPKRTEATQVVRDFLKDATTRIVYDLDRYMREGKPPFAATIARETHVSDLGSGPPSRLQVSFSYSDGFGREIQKKIQAEPGPLDVHDAKAPPVNPRWVGSGWTIFNNKGKPVRQYEPFFTAKHDFEFGVLVGVSPVLFYDSAERVIATLHPNHTYEKVVFDPWQQTTYDVNDTSAPRNLQTGDPRTDPDIKAYVAEYFKAIDDPNKPWQTWYQQRQTGALGTAEQVAASKAADHADTPTTAHFDAIGRPFLTIARNRVVCPGHALDHTDESFETRVELDIEGNQRAVRDAIVHAGDPYGRIVMQYDYDMLGNRIHQSSMEAGARWMLNDVAGKPVRAWDSRGHNFATAYDALRRPIEQTVQGTNADSDPRTRQAETLLVDKIEYGETQSNPEALNLRTRIYRHSDSAGIVTNAATNPISGTMEAYDFKGNLLRSTRQLISDYQGIADWRLAPALDSETFTGSTRYDALNRPVQSIAPHSDVLRGEPAQLRINVVQPVFNEANLLERVDVWLERATEPAGLLDRNTEPPSPVGVDNIDYDAKGQRLRIDYKNGATTRYDYDAETFRLIHLRTVRGKQDAADCAPVLDPRSCEDPPAICRRLAASACVVQDLQYVYDPTGNITHIQDDAQQIIYFNNQCVEPSNDYTYDAVYRLIEGRGREHLGQQANGQRNAPTAPDAFNAFHTRLDHPGDGNAMGRYIERYVYDAVGNFKLMQHWGGDSGKQSWKRNYVYDEASLIEPGNAGTARKTSNRLSSTTLNPDSANPQPEPYAHDAHGNMTGMPHLPLMRWDYHDQLQATARQVVNNGGTAETSYYVYDSSGQRVRKVTERQVPAGQVPTRMQERIYLGGFEIFREFENDGITVELERETLHVMDDKQRIALVETRTFAATPDPRDPLRLIRYHFGNHLGSASLELDDQARIISYEEYAPYGSSTYQAVRSQTETVKRYRYTGKERDEESGLYYYGARYYASGFGRWTKTDPLISLSPMYCGYQYCSSNPIVFRDKDGLRDDWAMDPGALSFAVPGPDWKPPPNSDAPALDKMVEGLQQQWSQGSPADKVELASTAVGAVAGLIPYLGDYVSVASSAIALAAKPSWSNLGNLSLDAVGALLPIVPALGTLRRGEGLDSAGKLAKAGLDAPEATTRYFVKDIVEEGDVLEAAQKSADMGKSEINPITDPRRMLNAGGETSTTKRRVENARGTNFERSEAANVHSAELHRGKREIPEETKLGGRRHDVKASSGTATDLRIEVKNFKRFLTVEGKKVANEVPLSKVIEQVHKDVLFVREGAKRGEHRVVQWEFYGAPPSPELEQFLQHWKLPYTYEVRK